MKRLEVINGLEYILDHSMWDALHEYKDLRKDIKYMFHVIGAAIKELEEKK